jgi:segregation and condensation protein B
MSQEHVNEPQESQTTSAEPLAAKPKNTVLDQYLDTVPMEAQEDTDTDDSLQDYADKHVEALTELENADVPAENGPQDSVEELLDETETDPIDPPQPDANTEEPEEITLAEDTSVSAAEDTSGEIALAEEEDQAELSMPDPATTTHPDDALSTQTTVDSVVEAVLFACDEPVTVAKLAGIVECTPKQVRTSIDTLNEQYKQQNRAFRIEQIAGGLQMLTLPYYDHWLRKMIKVRADNKLTPSALETLAIVAYKQPAIRADIEAIRGVASGEMLRGLMVKGLVKMVGRAEVVGRPMQYGTTKKFLECFGLNTLKDLPEIEELKRPIVEPKEDEE